MKEDFIPEIKVDDANEIYCKKDIKHNDRQRKKLNILQYGNSLVAFVFPKTDIIFEYLDVWWNMNYSAQGEDFKCELYENDDTIELLFFEETPFYKGKSDVNSVVDEKEWYVLKYLDELPEDFHEDILFAKLSDWDYSDYCSEVEYIELEVIC